MTDEIVAAAEILQGAVDEQAASQIEAAQQHAADAIATAQAITDAALQTELGRKIDIVDQENRTWRMTLEARLNSLDLGLSEIRTRLEAPATVVMAQPSLIQEASDPVVPQAEPILPVEPGHVGADGHEAPESEPRRQRTARRRVI
jgi:hypothetical protein